MYFHVYLIYRFTRTFTDHSSVITRCWGFELQNGKSSLKSPKTLVTPDFARASFLSTHSIPQISERIAPRCARFGIPALFVNQIFTKEVRHAEGHARHSRPRRLGKNDPTRSASLINLFGLGRVIQLDLPFCNSNPQHLVMTDE